ncbi:hypothetical protein CDD83_6360 [Cordyceps sp. RAO-2017]|nr:hypothetical protein CDD83_6360 [Cordyceps sp. RAO-2017]
MPVQQQHGQASQQGPSHAPKAKSGPAAKSYKIPPKQSPVPLPANFLAAMASSPSSIQGSNSGPLPPAAAGGPPPTLTAREPAKAAAPAPVRGPAGLAISPRPESMPVQGVRSSVTPVPVPVPAPRLSNPPPAQAPPPQTMMARPAAALPMTGSAMAAAMLAAPGPGPASAGPGPLQQQQQQQGHANGPPAGPLHGAVGQAQQQEFPDVPGCESMRFVERMMENLKRVSQRGATDGGGG